MMKWRPEEESRIFQEEGTEKCSLVTLKRHFHKLCTTEVHFIGVTFQTSRQHFVNTLFLSCSFHVDEHQT
jgi:hypothetical protein